MHFRCEIFTLNNGMAFSFASNQSSYPVWSCANLLKFFDFFFAMQIHFNCDRGIFLTFPENSKLIRITVITDFDYLNKQVVKQLIKTV